jgi:hydroxyethylthiazole kinase-like uncharacterized protein yjeF
MTEIRFVAEIRAAEGQVLSSLPAGELMGRAAAGLAATCARLLRAGGGVYGARVVVLVGTGNNGGDALFAAARLAVRGALVGVVLLGTPHAAGLAACRAAGAYVVTMADAPAALRSADLVLDGIVGIGGRGPLTPEGAALAAAAVAGGGLRVAVDLPSGVLADTGEVLDPAAVFPANVTVTFGARKAALVLDPAAAFAGVVEVVDIGLGGHWAEPANWRLAGPPEVARWFAVPVATSNKYLRGVVGIAAGSREYPGAAVLATGAARYGGAGYVRYVGAAGAEVLARWPEIVVGTGRVQAWVVGPGLGTTEAAAAQVREVLAADVPVVVDADALTLVAKEPELLEMLRARTHTTVLTPHARELARLLVAGGIEQESDRLLSIRRLADSLGAIVLAKGPATIVAPPGGGTGYVVRSGSAALATAGTGDVLSGLLGSALARAAAGGHPTPVRVAELAAAAAWVHGVAGRITAGDPAGPIAAGDLLASLSAAAAGPV